MLGRGGGQDGLFWISGAEDESGLPRRESRYQIFPSPVPQAPHVQTGPKKLHKITGEEGQRSAKTLAKVPDSPFLSTHLWNGN